MAPLNSFPFMNAFLFHYDLFFALLFCLRITNSSEENKHELMIVSVSLSQNAKPFSSSDSLAKVQEVASWLLEMNQDLLSGGSSSRRSRGPGSSAARGNASSTTRAPQQQAAEEGDEDEHMNRVVEEEERLQQRVSRPRWAGAEADGCSALVIHLIGEKKYIIGYVENVL